MTPVRTSRGKTPVRRRTLYGRRKGRPLRPGRQRLVEELLPRIRLPLARGGEEEPGDAGPPIEPLSLFTGEPPYPGGAAQPFGEVWLEVGFGAGEHLAAQAQAHPDVGFIGCEPFVNGVAALLARIDRLKLNNIRIFDDDARLVIDRLAPASLARVFVLFPDPWPKSRHAGRRFISADTLDALARAMAAGAELRFATDDATLLR
ncbi:MAG TPA: tRNA (guanine(46)-N(7))-methyltransferase TrmB, partial [Alphaproteobacteria bacterium]|nr:tRNA (guanine(46)-N(7))-methyltransferase TrmB [Alphaproteobacteria bacterium]